MCLHGVHPWGGAPVLPSGPLYSAFRDPLVNDHGEVAFLAARARFGDKAPGRARGDRREVEPVRHLRAPKRRGQRLVNLTETFGGDTTAENKQVILGDDSTSKLRRLLRLKDTLALGTPRSRNPPCSRPPSASSSPPAASYANGSLAILATFSDWSQALLRVNVP